MPCISSSNTLLGHLELLYIRRSRGSHALVVYYKLKTIKRHNCKCDGPRYRCTIPPYLSVSILPQDATPSDATCHNAPPTHHRTTVITEYWPLSSAPHHNYGFGFTQCLDGEVQVNS